MIIRLATLLPFGRLSKMKDATPEAITRTPNPIISVSKTLIEALPSETAILASIEFVIFFRITAPFTKKRGRVYIMSTHF
jgi:hypothetical protein